LYVLFRSRTKAAEPLLVFVEGNIRSEFHPPDVSLWQQLGIVTLGRAGAEPRWPTGYKTKDSRAASLRFMAMNGPTGSGPVIAYTENVLHAIENNVWNFGRD